VIDLLIIGVCECDTSDLTRTKKSDTSNTSDTRFKKKRFKKKREKDLYSICIFVKGKS